MLLRLKFIRFIIGFIIGFIIRLIIGFVGFRVSGFWGTG